MAEILRGRPVAKRIDEDLRERTHILSENGVKPVLGILRVGEDPSDIAYERGAIRKAEKIGVSVLVKNLPHDADQKCFEDAVKELRDDPKIHGILPMRPFPQTIEEEKIMDLIPAEKDVDGITDISLAGVFTGSEKGFTPCTAEACIEILDFYGIDLQGKKAVVIGRSNVIGKPVSMLLLRKNATVTICHTKTLNLKETVRDADILVTSAGCIESVTPDLVNPEMTVIDVSVNFDEDGNMKGDLTEEAADISIRYTPVPGGVGSVTTSILMRHVVKAAEMCLKKEKEGK